MVCKLLVRVDNPDYPTEGTVIGHNPDPSDLFRRIDGARDTNLRIWEGQGEASDYAIGDRVRLAFNV